MILLKHIFWTMFFSLSIMNLNAQKTAKVVRVLDGDTYTLLIGGKLITARLMNIDAPEMSQLYGKQAQQKVESILLTKDVEFRIDGKDKYKRYLVNIWVDGERLDSILVGNGLAWHYVEYSSEEMLAKLQKKAIRKQVGLWEHGVNGICPPWLYRHYNKLNRMRYCSNCKQ